MSEGKPCSVLPPRLLQNARVLAARKDILPLLPKGGTFAEIGVALGDYSAAILQVCRPARFLAIDIFTVHEATHIWGKPTANALGGRTHEEHYRNRFSREIGSGQVCVLRGQSTSHLLALPDGSIDVAYVDADHTYDFVSAELAVLQSKVARDGWIVLNDYTMGNVTGAGFKRFGVIQAAHEFMIRHGWEMMYLALHPLMYCDVALRRL